MSLSPSSAELLPAGTQQFTANLQGISNTEVAWGVDGISGGNSAVGTIDSNGLYRAPNATGGHVIAATSAADSSGSVQAHITVFNKAAGAVLTYHNDDARDGAFTEETTLTPLSRELVTVRKTALLQGRRTNLRPAIVRPPT